MPLTITHAKSNTIGDFTGTVTVYNSSAGTVTCLATDLVRPSDWNSGHVGTYAAAASEIASVFSAGSGLSRTTNTAGITFGLAPQYFFEPWPMPNSNSVMDAPSIGVWYFEPFVVPFGLNSGRINLFNQRDSSIFLNAVTGNSASSGAFTMTASFRNCVAIYSQLTGSSNSALTSVWTGEAAWSATRSCSYASGGGGTDMRCSNYLTIGFNSQFNSTGGVTTTTQTASGTVSVGATSMASTLPNSLITVAQNWFSGSIMDIVPFSTYLPPGNYWMARMHTTHTGGAGTTGQNFTSAAHTMFNGSNSRLGHLDVQLSVFKQAGQATSANSTSHGIPFHGSLLTTTSQATASVKTVDVQNFTRRHYWNFVQDTL